MSNQSGKVCTGWVAIALILAQFRPDIFQLRHVPTSSCLTFSATIRLLDNILSALTSASEELAATGEYSTDPSDVLALPSATKLAKFFDDVKRRTSDLFMGIPIITGAAEPEMDLLGIVAEVAQVAASSDPDTWLVPAAGDRSSPAPAGAGHSASGCASGWDDWGSTTGSFAPPAEAPSRARAQDWETPARESTSGGSPLRASTDTARRATPPRAPEAARHGHGAAEPLRISEDESPDHGDSDSEAPLVASTSALAQKWPPSASPARTQQLEHHGEWDMSPPEALQRARERARDLSASASSPGSSSNGAGDAPPEPLVASADGPCAVAPREAEASAGNPRISPTLAPPRPTRSPDIPEFTAPDELLGNATSVDLRKAGRSLLDSDVAFFDNIGNDEPDEAPASPSRAQVPEFHARKERPPLAASRASLDAEKLLQRQIEEGNALRAQLLEAEGRAARLEVELLEKDAELTRQKEATAFQKGQLRRKEEAIAGHKAEIAELHALCRDQSMEIQELRVELKRFKRFSNLPATREPNFQEIRVSSVELLPSPPAAQGTRAAAESPSAQPTVMPDASREEALKALPDASPEAPPKAAPTVTPTVAPAAARAPEQSPARGGDSASPGGAPSPAHAAPAEPTSPSAGSPDRVMRIDITDTPQLDPDAAQRKLADLAALSERRRREYIDRRLASDKHRREQELQKKRLHVRRPGSAPRPKTPSAPPRRLTTSEKSLPGGEARTYVPIPSYSNERQVRNALTKTCLAGAPNAAKLTQALSKLTREGQGHFIVVLRSRDSFHYRGLLRVHPETGRLIRVDGKLPPSLPQTACTHLFKYDSARRSFNSLDQHMFSGSVSAVLLKPSRKPRRSPGFP
eukprot:gnl/Chilomastix_cuspidata/4568.p1 GENE.gnl/Chilomastix_cuspidata/4568~~gnl/Chilomastix_cuspidata/4568.p1  ORF type:complete len:939 (-),score=341.04 gnl/Chilomastix_cuspidata/4568:44-2641(-)